MIPRLRAGDSLRRLSLLASTGHFLGRAATEASGPRRERSPLFRPAAAVLQRYPL